MAAKRSFVRRVFLSSTARDLGPHCEAVFKAISGMDGFQCVRMEDFGARDWEADPLATKVVAALRNLERQMGAVEAAGGETAPPIERVTTVRVESSGVDGRGAKSNLTVLMEYLSQRAGILVPRGGFSHSPLISDALVSEVCRS